MKKFGLIFVALIFFATVNSSYYWEGKLGLLAIPVIIILTITFIILTILFFKQLYLTTKEKFHNKLRILTLGLLFTVLTTTFIKPLDLFNFEYLEKNNVLVANTEGSANCSTTLKLKNDFTFKERTLCFGITEISGKYHIINDTIYFENTDDSNSMTGKYKYGIIKTSKFIQHKNQTELVRYKNADDTNGNILMITSNSIKELK